MRRLVLMRGLPGSGKSTWLKNRGLEQYVLSSDAIRLMLNSPVMDSNGNYSISQAQNKRVFEMLFEILESRMDRGEFVIVDATHKKTSDFDRYMKLARKYFYSVACVDLSIVPLETCLAQNASRESYKYVPAEVISAQFAEIKKFNVPKSVTTINPYNDEFEKWVNIPVVDLNRYKKLHFLGDIQGCMDPLNEYFKDGFKDDEYYVFTGDFIDRGIQNGLVVKWAIENLIHRRNVSLIMGNHELHLLRWCVDRVGVSQEFDTNTLPQIIEAGVTKEQVYSFVRKMQDIMIIQYNKKTIYVTHAGLCKLPKEGLEYITSKQLVSGAGNYGEPVDKLFAENHPDLFQIHGHRNKNGLPVLASANSVNLESRVEFGNYFRAVVLEKV